MFSRNDGWAVGADTEPPFDGSLLRWNGIEWKSVSMPSPPWPVYMKDISVPNGTSAWLAGGIIVCTPAPGCNPSYALGTISHWNGSAWSSTSIQDVSLSSISMISDTDGWAVGTEIVQPGLQLRSSILHWDGSTWSAAEHPQIEYAGGSVQYILEEVSARNASTAWSAVSHQNLFLRWDGTTWSQVYSPVNGVPAIAVNSSEDAWTVGAYGDIGHWDGSHWNLAVSPVGVTLTSVSMVSPYEGWAVGDSGTILHGVSNPFIRQWFLPVLFQ
jgi:hypothetical protein